MFGFLFFMADISKTKTTKEKKEITQDLMYSYAYSVKQGNAGGSYFYCLENNKFYNYKDGYWQQLFMVEFLGRIEENLKQITRHAINKKKQIAENFKNLGRKHLSELNCFPFLNLENYMIDPAGDNVLKHEEKYLSTIRIPYKYDKLAKCELWIKSLNEIFENNQVKIGILQEYFGYCLTREIKHHKALLLLGESRSGKSTILQTFRNVIGNLNCSSLPLKHISNPQSAPMLMNKLVNIDTDVSSKAEEFEAEFKTITSGEPVYCNQKYVDTFDFVPYCKIIMAANIFPRITDHSSAFYKRLILIPCDKIFSYEEQNRDLPLQLTAELPGILNWAIEGLKKLTKRGMFEELDFMKDAIQELEDENNPSNLFFDEYIQVDMSDGIYIEKGELFIKYQNWCKETNTYVLNKARFASAVYKRFHKVTPKDTKHPETKKRIWKNLKYVLLKKENQPDEGWQE